MNKQFALLSALTQLTSASLTSLRIEQTCVADAEACDSIDFYYNWLACDCHASIQCERGCQAGFELDPRQICGSCLPSEKTSMALYPSWATADDIKNAREKGIEAAATRPKSWKVCPKGTSAAKQCDAGFYWNELACECFANGQCKKGCPGDDMRLDPAQSCGDCYTQKQEFIKYYPRWADPYDVETAEDAGRQFIGTDDTESWKVCPNQPFGGCTNGLWNELACECFKKVVCMGNMCETGSAFDPRLGCKCQDASELRDDLYPSWATEDDIRKAVNASWSAAGATNLGDSGVDESEMMDQMMSAVESLLGQTGGASNLKSGLVAAATIALLATL